ncbi:MAG: tRNA (N(6)-L-threonylcarbamoyladenosine(37)-C(2))-methylthiotransferase MtaB, partial [bacterium]
MPVQAAADRVAARMRRQYDRALVRDVVAEIGRALPGAGLGTDVIAGFPGESEADFEAGLALLEGLPFTSLHVFPYSKQSGTTAAKAGDHLPPPIIAARAARLRQLGAAKRRAFAERFVGRPVRVLVERARDAASGRLIGYSRRYVRVVLDGPDDWGNREIAARGVARLGDRLLARAGEGTIRGE